MSGGELRRRGGPSGFATVPRHLLRHPHITALGVRIWGLLWDMYSDDSPNPYPGQKRLCEWAGASERAVRDAIKDLTRYGYLQVRHRGQGRTNIYTVVYDPVEQPSDPDRQNMPVKTGRTRRSRTAGPAGKAEPVEAEPVEATPSSSSATSRARADEPVDDERDQPPPEANDLTDELLDTAGVHHPPVPTETKLVAAALARGWSAEDLRAKAARAAIANRPRAYLLASIAELAGSDPPKPFDLPDFNDLLAQIIKGVDD